MKNIFPNNKELLEQFRKIAFKELPPEEKMQLWDSIRKSIEEPPRKVVFFRRPAYWVAASACILALISGVFFMNREPEANLISENKIEIVEENVSSDAVKIISVDGNEIEFEGDEPSIVADHISFDTLDEKTTRFNQLIVPSSKKSQLILEDGTKLWVNSDTKVIYPESFNKTVRRIIVDGEIYADVAHDKDRPFIVETKSMEIEVLGTEFNLTAYSTDKKQSVVLVKGKVEVQPSGLDAIILSPNSIVSVDEGEVTLRKGIDVYDYICWKDNYLVLNAISFGELVPKLNRYYGCNISFDKAYTDRILSGKLDLKNPVETIIESLSISLKYKYNVEGNKITIYHN